MSHKFQVQMLLILKAEGRGEGNQSLSLLVSHEIKPSGQKAALALAVTPAV